MTGNGASTHTLINDVVAELARLLDAREVPSPDEVPAARRTLDTARYHLDSHEPGQALLYILQSALKVGLRLSELFRTVEDRAEATTA